MTTRDRILDSAQRLLQTRSYAGFSFQDVADEVGIRKASIYSHFPSKDALVAQVLERVGQELSHYLAESDGRPAPERLAHFCRLYLRVSQGGERLCPIGCFAAVWSSVTPEVQSAVRAAARGVLDWVVRLLGEGRADGSLRDSGRPLQVEAEHILASVQGALLIARLTQDVRVVTETCDRLGREYLPA